MPLCTQKHRNCKKKIPSCFLGNNISKHWFKLSCSLLSFVLYFHVIHLQVLWVFFREWCLIYLLYCMSQKRQASENPLNNYGAIMSKCILNKIPLMNTYLIAALFTYNYQMPKRMILIKWVWYHGFQYKLSCRTIFVILMLSSWLYTKNAIAKF